MRFFVLLRMTIVRSVTLSVAKGLVSCPLENKVKLY